MRAGLKIVAYVVGTILGLVFVFGPPAWFAIANYPWFSPLAFAASLAFASAFLASQKMKLPKARTAALAFVLAFAIYGVPIMIVFFMTGWLV